VLLAVSLQQRERDLALKQSQASGHTATGVSKHSDDQDVILDRHSMQSAVGDAQRSNALKTANDTYKKLKEDLLRSRRAVNVLTGTDAAKVRCVWLKITSCFRHQLLRC
jgi:LAS superfamily LD-carboxypeptidase LdcB